MTKADEKTEAAVMKVVGKLFDPAVLSEVNAIVALFTPDPDVVIIGIKGTEKRIGPAGVRAAAEYESSQSDDLSVKWGWHSVSAAGPVAWVAADLTVYVKAGGQEATLPARLTSVLEWRGDRWGIAQLHISSPAAE